MPLSKVAPGSIHQGSRPAAFGLQVLAAEYDPDTETFHVPARVPASALPASRRAAFELTTAGVYTLRQPTGADALAIAQVGADVLVYNPSTAGTVAGDVEVADFNSSDGAVISDAVVFSASGGTVVEVRIPYRYTPPAVTSVEVVPAAVASLAAGATVQLTATPKDADGNALPDAVTWTTSAPGVATVVDGLVTGVAGGTAEIRATTANGVYGSCAVTVPASVATVEVTPSPATAAEGATLQLTGTPRDSSGNALPDPLTWASSAPAVAAVSSSGLVTGVAGGTATINAQAENGVTGSTLLTVTKPAVYVADFTAMPDGAPAGMTTYVVSGKPLYGPLTVSAGEARFAVASSNDHGIATRNGTNASAGWAKARFRMNNVRAGFNERCGGLILLGTPNAAAALGFTGIRLHTDLAVDSGQVTLQSNCYNQAGTEISGPGGVLATFADLTNAVWLWIEAEAYYVGSTAHVRIRIWKDGTAVPAWPASGTSSAAARDFVLGSQLVGTTGAFGVASRSTNPRYARLEAGGSWV